MNRRTQLHVTVVILIGVLAFALMQAGGCGQNTDSSRPIPVEPVAASCSRFLAGSVVQNPPALFSENGVLTVNFSYQTTTTSDGRTLDCFMTPDGLQNPTLHVNPGDDLLIKVTNNTPALPADMTINPPNCGAAQMTRSSLNIHYHGTNTSPTCGQDEVIHTIINSGETFQYNVAIPPDEPPGLYWYHPHIHGLVEGALQAGASGAIVVDGIENVQPAVAGLNQQILIIRDQPVAGNPTPGGAVPSWDLTLNYIPIAYPAEVPAVIQMLPGEQQLWRVSNSSSDSILDLQVLFDGVSQTLQIVGLDGVPTGSQDGTGQGQIVNATHILLPTAARAEFIVSAPPQTVKNASLVTLNISTGPDGGYDPPRTMATIQTGLQQQVKADSRISERRLPLSSAQPGRQRFKGLGSATLTAQRTLFFSEDNRNSQFFITVAGATPTLFGPNNPPAVTTTQGSVEDWTIQNFTFENHEFHIHQIHFLVLSQDNFGVNGSQPEPTIQGQYLDMIQVPFWDGNPNHPFPSVTLRMDFRRADIGDFVYHCHIAEHEDHGMMAVIRVLPRSDPANAVKAAPAGMDPVK